VHRIFTTSVSSVYPRYIAEVGRKRTKAELVDEVAKGRPMEKILRGQEPPAANS
jgi:hypothetical protein